MEISGGAVSSKNLGGVVSVTRKNPASAMLAVNDSHTAIIARTSFERPQAVQKSQPVTTVVTIKTVVVNNDTLSMAIKIILTQR